MAKNATWYQKNFFWKRLRINRKYKDRLFRFLFRNKTDLLALYNAVNGSSYSDPERLEIVTLDDVIFMKMKNDLSFMISNQLNLYEHQSTYSPNMPLRGLIYFTHQYEGLLTRQDESLRTSSSTTGERNSRTAQSCSYPTPSRPGTAPDAWNAGR